jgi:hypothetical protein
MEKILLFLGVIALVVLIALIFALPTMWLWNGLMPYIFGLVQINFWKALGINLLCGILFKNSNYKID